MTLLTEEQAKQRWCPFGNVDDGCCASECMAWRWGDGEISRAEYSDAVPAGKGMKDDWKDPRGFCGLARKP